EAADHLKLFSTLSGIPDTSKAIDVSARFKAVTNMTLNFFDATYYDACWIYALSMVNAPSLDFMDVKTELPKTASTYSGVTGLCNLNAAGDRVITNYDIWGYSLDTGALTSEKYGYYDSVTGQVEWSTPSPNMSPVVHINGPYTGGVRKDISFHSSGSYDPDGTIEEYNWDFGDNSESHTMSPIHLYSSAGNFSVRLTIVDNEGAVNTNTTYCVVSQVGDSPLTMEQIAAIISIGGAGAGLIGWVVRTRRERTRKNKLFKGLLEGVDDIYTRFKMNARTCEAELYKYKNQVLEEFKKGMIDENSYDILNTRIEKYLEEIITEIKKQ
ncbi:MAG: PKD domain-containing protein, partial [Candidatus Bathyarchaeia archaeon]